MNNAAILDVREMPPRIRHPKIFETFDGLRTGEAFELVNDHDPKPLFYQFQHERPDQFKWDYQEEGPDVWRVSIGKVAGGKREEATRQPAPSKPLWAGKLDKGQEVLLDVRPFFKSGLEPFEAIMETVKALKDNQHLNLVSSFEPFPLYGVLGKQGFEHYTESKEGVWSIYFKKVPGKGSATGAQSAPQQEDLFDRMVVRIPRIELDVRGLEPPEPLVKILEALPSLPPGGLLFVHHHREPVLLYDKLRERGFEAVARKMGESDYKVLIWKKEG